MSDLYTQLQEKIGEIDTLGSADRWGVDYKIWLKETRELVAQLFDKEYLGIFDGLRTTVTSYIDKNFNQRQYLKELEKRSNFLVSMLEKTAKPVQKEADETSQVTNSSAILKNIWQQEQHLKDNLLTTNEAKQLQDQSLALLDKTLIRDSGPGLRFRKRPLFMVVESSRLPG